MSFSSVFRDQLLEGETKSKQEIVGKLVLYFYGNITLICLCNML